MIPWRRDRLPTPYSWASLVVQRVQNPPSMWETWVWSLGWENPLEEGMTTHSSILTWRIPMDRGAWWATVHGVARVEHDWSDWACAQEYNQAKNQRSETCFFIDRANCPQVFRKSFLETALSVRVEKEWENASWFYFSNSKCFKEITTKCTVGSWIVV